MMQFIYGNKYIENIELFCVLLKTHFKILRISKIAAIQSIHMEINNGSLIIMQTLSKIYVFICYKGKLENITALNPLMDLQKT